MDPDLREAKLTLELVQEQRLPAIVKAQNEAVSVILQVLYFLQRGHVRFLMGDYKARVLEAHGHDAFTAKVKTEKPGKDGLPRSIHDVNPSNPTPGQTVDICRETMTREHWVPMMKVRNSTTIVMVKVNRLTPMFSPPHNRKDLSPQ